MYIDESPAYFYQERLELRSPTRGAATVLLTMTYIIRTFAVLVLAAGTAIAVKWGDDGQSFPDMSSNLRDTICVVIFFCLCWVCLPDVFHCSMGSCPRACRTPVDRKVNAGKSAGVDTTRV